MTKIRYLRYSSPSWLAKITTLKRQQQRLKRLNKLLPLQGSTFVTLFH